MQKKKTVVIGLSGGVDSSVAAKLLIESGYFVIGLFMHNWEEQDDGGACTQADDWEDARAVAAKLGIPIYSVNFSAEYMENVFGYFLDEYKKGRTPNPDVLCNREIKFGPFVREAEKLGADYIATGHYCAVSRDFDGGARLMKAADKAKDQTYFLNQVRTRQLEKVLFPLGGLIKSEVREIAEREGLVTAKKKDSTGICFIGERNFKEFLSTYLPAMKGRIVDTAGKEIGEHDGLMYYTLGQRRGLGIGGVKSEKQSRWYVVDKRLESNELVVSCGEGEELFSSRMKVTDINIIGEKPESGELRVDARCRYRSPLYEAVLKTDDFLSGEIEFNEPQRAATPGQYVVFYDGERCLGGGVIDKINTSNY